MKKIVLIIVNLLLVTILCVSSFYLYKVLQNRQITQFINEKKTSLLVNSQYDVQDGNIGHHHITACFPTDAEGKRIAAVERMIHEKIRNSLGDEKPLGEINELVFISTSDSPTNIPSVRRTEISSKSFKISGLKVTSSGTDQPQSILLTAANQPFSLPTLLPDLGKAREIFSGHLKVELEKKQLAAEQENSYLTAFVQLDMQVIDFAYEEGNITLHLSEEQVGLSQLTVAISAFFDIIDAQYLMETDRQAYEAYQIEQAEKLRQATEQMVSLTFDDGPNPKTTPLILDILKKYNAKATFFILGQNIAGNEDIIRRMVAEGHEVANHSWSHPDFTKLTPDQIKQEVEQTQATLEQITGQRPLMVRPPYGAVNQTVMNAMNLPAIYWSVDSLDWKTRDPKAILNVIQANTRPGSIVLLHDIHQPTAESIEPVIQYLQGQGYNLGTLSNLLGPNLNSQLIYYDRDSSRPAQ